MSWSRFVAVTVFLDVVRLDAGTPGKKRRTGTVIGMVAFVAVLWVALRLTGN